jgi:hypothetical protein
MNILIINFTVNLIIKNLKKSSVIILFKHKGNRSFQLQL